MFPSQHVEDSQDLDAEFAPEHPESDEGSDREHEADADESAAKEGEEEEAAADDLGKSAPLGSLRDWTDDSGKESAGAVGTAPKQPASGSATKRQAALEQPGAYGSRSAGKKLAHRKRCAASLSIIYLPSWPRKIQRPKKVPESTGYVFPLCFFGFALSFFALPVVFVNWLSFGFSVGNQ
jgi:hypothetical protein